MTPNHDFTPDQIGWMHTEFKRRDKEDWEVENGQYSRRELKRIRAKRAMAAHLTIGQLEALKNIVRPERRRTR